MAKFKVKGDLMPEYKKKKRNKIFSSNAPKKAKKSANTHSENIKMSPTKRNNKAENEESLKVVKGKKLEQKRKIKIFSMSIAALAVILIVLQICLPAGLLSSISNAVALMGSGSYPIELESTDTISAVSKNSYYYVLTNNNLNAFTNSGKQLFSYPHGFENPVLKTSSSGAVLFDLGGTELQIFNFSGLMKNIIFKQKIITAAISDSGKYAVATHSDKYTSAVTVYNKNSDILYEWFSAEDTVNNIALSSNGRKLAVSVFNSDVGGFKSKVYVLNYKSATPEYTEQFDNTVIYTLDTSFKNGFTVVYSKGIKHIKWFNYKEKSYSADYNVSYFKAGKNGFVAVFNRENDKTDSKIAVFNSAGKLKYETYFKGIISDIAISGGHIYCISDTAVYLLSNKGEIIKSADCGFGAVNLSVTEANSVAVITDNKIEKIKLQEEK